MKTIDFHVTLQSANNPSESDDRRKMVKCIEKGNIMDGIRDQFKLDQSVKFRLMYYENSANDWVDIDEGCECELPNGGKLKAVIVSRKENHDETHVNDFQSSIAYEMKGCTTTAGPPNYKSVVKQNYELLLRAMNTTPELLFELSMLPSIGDSLISDINGQTNEERNRQLISVMLSISDRFQDAAFRGFLNALRKHHQEHVANVFHKQSEKMPMSDKNYESLMKNMGEIEMFLDPENSMIDELVTHEVFTDSEARQVRGVEREDEKCRAILNILPYKCNEAFNGFIGVLRRNGQDHVAYILTGQGSHPMTCEHIDLFENKLKELRKFLDADGGVLEELNGVFNNKDRRCIRSKNTMDEKALHVIQLLQRKSDDAYDKFIAALHATKQSHVVYILTGEGDPPMSTERIDFINENRTELIKSIESVHSSLIDILVSDKVISDFDRQRIESKGTCHERNAILLEVIIRKPQTAYDKFVRALHESTHTQVASALNNNVCGKVKLDFASDTSPPTKQEIQSSVRRIIENQMDTINETEILKPNGISVVYTGVGSIVISFKCSHETSVNKLRELLSSKALDMLFTETFCPAFTAKGLKSLRIDVAEKELDRCARAFQEFTIMASKHRQKLQMAAELLKDKILVTSDLLNKLTLCQRRRRAVEAAKTSEQAETLLSIISHQSDFEYAQLVAALKQTGQNDAANFLELVPSTNRRSDIPDWKSIVINQQKAVFNLMTEKLCLEKVIYTYRHHFATGNGIPGRSWKKNDLHMALENGLLSEATELMSSRDREYVAEYYYDDDGSRSRHFRWPFESASINNFKSCIHLIAAIPDSGKALSLCSQLVDKLGENAREFLDMMTTVRFADLVQYPIDMFDVRNIYRDSLQFSAAPIHIAAYNGNAGVTDLLCKVGVSAGQKAVECNGHGWRLSPLHLAALGDKADTMETLLRQGADVNEHIANESIKSHSTLVIAVLRCNTNAVKILLDYHADVNATGDDRLSPLHAAVATGNEPVVRMLLEAGAHINALDLAGITPLCRAVKCNHMCIVKLLLDNNADINNLGERGVAGLMPFPAGPHHRECSATLGKILRDPDNVTPLRAAVQCQNADIVEELLKHKADVDKNDPLHAAVHGKDDRIIKLLLDNGARADTLSTCSSTKSTEVDLELVISLHPDSPKESPLHAAACQGNTDIMESLVLSRNCGSINSVDENGATPLYRAVETCNIDIVKLLLDNGADANHYLRSTPTQRKRSDVDIREQTIFSRMSLSFEDPHLPGFGLIGLTSPTAKLSPEGRLGRVGHRIPLHSAVRQRDKNMTRMLIGKGANVNLCDGKGISPLHLAVDQDDVEMVRFLLDSGANPHLADCRKVTALMKASARGNMQVAELLIRKGANTNDTDNKGKTPLYNAVYGKNELMVQLLLSKDARVDSYSNSETRETILHVGVKQGQVNVVSALIAAGAEVNATDKDGNTPLHVASELGDVPIVRMLLRKGADMNMKRSDGNTALHLAIKKGSVEVVTLLLNEGASINVDRSVDDLWPDPLGFFGSSLFNILPALSSIPLFQGCTSEGEINVSLDVDKRKSSIFPCESATPIANPKKRPFAPGKPPSSSDMNIKEWMTEASATGFASTKRQRYDS